VLESGACLSEHRAREQKIKNKQENSALCCRPLPFNCPPEKLNVRFNCATLCPSWVFSQYSIFTERPIPGPSVRQLFLYSKTKQLLLYCTVPCLTTATEYALPLYSKKGNTCPKHLPGNAERSAIRRGMILLVLHSLHP